ncbi:ABC transporter substrate-binding protein [Shewanella salipaludis]|uniref:ABC transporter substrate-binding protein n=1 Tax=Shewanella salipaludis TaxID=2723052 RepID=A0A972JJY9_9GAMM|nr:ABC transporter substrate-binding protein [Shewanella salipaludis]NMH63787.1 ABC transporter substrate-binding protein [Shewanella salipaludis]
MKKVLLLCLVVALICIPAYLWLRQEPLQPPARKISIAISTTPLSAPFIVAKARGLFRQHGLEVELQPLDGGLLCFQKLIARQVYMATSSESVVMFNSFEHDDFSVLASFAESDKDIKLLSLKASGLSRPQQLAAKRIGIVEASSSEFFLYAYMLLSGHGDLGFTQVNMPVQELASALLEKRVDAISVWEPYGHQLQRLMPQEWLEFDTKGVYSLSFNLLGHKTDDPEDLRTNTRVLRALAQAIDVMDSEPAQAKRLVGQYLDMPAAELDALWPDYVFKLSLGNALIANLQMQAHWAIATGQVRAGSTPDFRRLLDHRALNSLPLFAQTL